MANFFIPGKFTAAQIKALSDKEEATSEGQVKKICDKGHLIDDFGPADFSEDNRRIVQSPISHYEPDVTGLSVRRRSSGVAIRGERGQFAKALKEAKTAVKVLNAGQSLLAFVSVPTGRLKGRPKLVAA